VNTFALAMADDQQFAIVTADLSLKRNRDAGTPTSINRYGRGKAYPTTTRELVDATRKLHERGCTAVMWATHFPPSPPGECASMLLLDSDELAAAARQCGVRYLLAGHIHRRERYQIAGLEVLCAATSMAISSDGNQIHVLAIEVTNGSITAVNCQDHVYDVEEQTFI
jgi:hypothetical protein